MGERIEDRVDDLLDVAFRCIDRERCARVSLTPLLHQLGNPLLNRHAALRQQRTRFDAARDPSRNHLRSCTEADNQAAVVERGIILRVDDRATAG